MIRDEQVRVMRQELRDGKPQVRAAAAAGKCERTARKWQRGVLPSESKKARHWRMRVIGQTKLQDGEGAG